MMNWMKVGELGCWADVHVEQRGTQLCSDGIR